MTAAFRLSTRPSILAARRAGGRRFRERRSLPLRTATREVPDPPSDRPLLPLLPSVWEECSEGLRVSSVAARSTLMASISGNWNWRRAVVGSNLKATTKHVLLTLSIHVADSGESAFPSLKTLSKETGRTRKTCQTHLREAEALGWVARETRHHENGRQTSNVYHLTAPLSSIRGGVISDPPGGVTGTLGEGVTDDPLTTLRGPRRNGKENTSDQGDLMAASRDVYEKLWLLCKRGSKKAGWEQYRTAVPKKITAADIHEGRRIHVDRADHPRFVKAIEIWIRDERWDEEVPESESMSAPPEAGTDAWAAAEHDRIMGDE